MHSVSGLSPNHVFLDKTDSLSAGSNDSRRSTNSRHLATQGRFLVALHLSTVRLALVHLLIYFWTSLIPQRHFFSDSLQIREIDSVPSDIQLYVDTVQ